MFSELSLRNIVFTHRSQTGNWKFKLLLLIIFLYYFEATLAQSIQAQSRTFQRGGILFEDIGGAQVNGEYISFKRVAETSKLEQGVQAGSDLAVIYNNLCTRVLESVRKSKLSKEESKKEEEKPKIETIISPLKYPISQGERVCKNLNAALPEIRNWEDHARILTHM